MPTYQYECDSCRNTFEILQSIKDKKLKTCPHCKKETLHRLIGTGSGIIFKGSGFYETDYKQRSNTPANEGVNKDSDKKADKKESQNESASAKSQEVAPKEK